MRYIGDMSLILENIDDMIHTHIGIPASVIDISQPLNAVGMYLMLQAFMPHILNFGTSKR